MILEYRDRIGGRVWQTDFGQDDIGNPYTIELGANWVCDSVTSRSWMGLTRIRCKD